MAHAQHSIGMEGPAQRRGSPPETDLWLAVVQEVIRTESSDDAERWLKSGDGQMVAAMAGLDPDWLVDRILPAAGRHAATKTRRHADQHLGKGRASRAALLAARARRHAFFRRMGWMS